MAIVRPKSQRDPRQALDSTTNAQKATTAKAMSDCPSIITGFARAMTGTISNNTMQTRDFIGPSGQPHWCRASDGLNANGAASRHPVQADG